LLAARAELRALDQRYAAARSALGPTIGVSGQQSWVDARVDQESLFFGKFVGRDRAETFGIAVTANQPLYSEGQLGASVRAAGADVEAGRAALRDREAGMLDDVIGAYVDVYLARQLVGLTEQDVAILRRQREDTEDRFAAREVTMTDRAQAHARFIAAETKLEQARARLTDAQAHYAAVVGQAPGELSPPPDLPGTPPSLDAALDAADRANPALATAQLTELASRSRVTEAKAADGLQVELSLSAASQPNANYLANSYDRSLSASIVFNKPLFTAGLHSARVNAAQETNYRDALRAADQQRKVIQQVLQGWNGLVTARRLLRELHDQLAEEQRAFEGARQEEKMGLRTTIDVLNAEQEMQATKVTLAQEFHDEYLQRVNLMGAVGVLRAELIDPSLDVYRPEQSFRSAVRAYALPWESLVKGLDSLGAPAMSAQPPSREPLRSARPTGPDTMPSAPHWAEAAADFAAPPL
jgi:outer membrane protein